MGETTNEIRPADDFEDPAIRGSSATQESHSSGDASDGGPEAARIRSDIEHTRADLSETINALQEKLDPTRIAEQVKDQVREKATEAYDTAKHAVKEATIGKAEKIVSNVSETVTDITGCAGTAIRSGSSSFAQYIRENPVAFALVGIGIGMLTLNARRREQSSYSPGRTIEPVAYDESGTADVSATTQEPITDRLRNVASGVADTARAATERTTGAVSSAAASVRDAASSAADTTRQQLDYVSGQVRQGTRVASDRFGSMLQENPMALGVAALAAGAIVGLTLPTTHVEGQYMGEARDRLVDQAKSAAQEAVEKVQHVAQEAGRTLKDAAQKEGLIGDS